MRADCLPNVSVAIHVNGNALHEYHAESEDAKTALCYVEAVSGAKFALVLTTEPGYEYRKDHLQFATFLDGSRARGKIIVPTKMKNRHTSSIDGVHSHIDGNNYYRKYTFAQHETTDKQPDQSLVQRLSELGEVTVTLQRCRKQGRTTHSDNTRPELTALGAGGIPEKALKGRVISYHAQLGEVERTMDRREFVHVTYPFGSYPIATYKFRYRSLGDLQAIGIVERSPSPVALEDRDPDDLTPQEASELIRRMRAEKEVAAKIKRDPEVKLENVVKREKAVKRQHSEMVGGEDGDEDGDDEDLSITDIVTPDMKRARVASRSYR